MTFRPFARLVVLPLLASVCEVLVPTAAQAATPPEWRQEAEAFSTKSTGAKFSDANASGGAAWSLWTNGSLQTTFTAVTTGAKQIDVVARGDVALGVWPIMRVYVDGTLRTEETVASSTYRTYSTTVTSLTSGSHTLKIEFANDDTTPDGEDRNLKVDVASVIPSDIEEWRQEVESFPTHTTGDDFGDTNASSGRYWNLWSNGHAETTMTATTSGTKQIKVTARGDVAAGVWPNMRITVGGQVLANHTVSTTSWKTYTTTATLSKGSHTLRVQFTNDATVNGEDRNLKVDVATLVPVTNEWKQEAESFSTKTAGASTSSSLASAGTFWNLWSNGYLSTTMTAASTGRKEIRVIARGAPAAGVYPNVKVWLGSTLLTTLTVSATTFSTYVVPATMNAGANTLKLEFVNNATINGEDRNVHLDVVTLVGDNAFPFVQGVASPANNSYVPAQAPLRVTYADPDGDTGYVDYELYNAATGVSVASTRSASANAGTVTSWTPGGLTNGTQYKWRARAYDGTSYASAWTAYQYFTVDAVAPGAPSVSSTTFPAGAWSGSDTTSGTFTFSPGGSTDVVGYKYGLDKNPPGTDKTGTTVTLAPGEGPHHLYVQSVDRAGNLSPITDYAFNVGAGGVTSPRTGDVTSKRFALRTVANPSFSGVTYQWRRADTDSWVNVPAADVTNGGSAVTWPVTLALGTHADLTWDVAATLGGVDGPLQIRASYGGGSATKGTRVRLDQRTAGAATAPVGSGMVNLLTGNLSLTATDASVAGFVSGVTVTRTYNSRDPQAGATGAFGPGWVSGLSVGGGASAYSGLTGSGTLRTVTTVGGDRIGFTATAPDYFAPQPGMEGLVLTRTAGSATTGDQTDDVYELSNPAGITTVFTWQGTGFVPTSIVEPGSDVKTTYTYQTVNGVTRVTRALAPVPAGVSCASPDTARGCRSLVLDYAPSTTPVPGAGGGDYADRLRSVSIVAWDPAQSAMRSVEVAHYSYLPSGRLLAAWNPALPALKMTYDYDANGRLATFTPPGEEPYTFAYTTLPSDPDGGRLKSFSRSALTAGTATTTFVYGVPLSGTGAPADLSAAQLARWGQTDAPVDATAVFPATQVPDGNQASGVLPTSYERAVVTYLDVAGRAVDVLTPGGHLAVTEYDTYDNVVRELTAVNRAKALAASATDTAADEAALASRWSTVSTYGSQGQELLEQLGPEHEVALVAPVTDSLGRTWPTGALVRARARTVNTFDEGAPPGTGPYHLVTTSSAGARIADTTTDTDVRTVTSTFDWTLRKPRTVTTDPGGLNLVSRMSYDADTRLVTRATLPGGTAAEDTAQTTVTTYYTAGTHSAYAECGNRPEWAGLECRVDPGGQPTVTTDHPAIPTKVAEYDLFNALTTTKTKIGSTVLRTTTVQYDSAHRPWRTSVTGTGDALPTVETYYDPATGQATETRTLDPLGNVVAQVTTAFDSLGRPTSFTDADGNTSTLTYDVLSRPVTTNDGKGTQTRYYDEGTERRGLLTRLVDSAAGTFTATYDADGDLATQTLPNGLVQTPTVDEAGVSVRLTYTKGGSTWLSFTANPTVHGQWAAASGNQSSQEFSYDAAGRLARVADTVAGLGCTVRDYTVDADSNRTGMTTRQPDGEGQCDPAAAGSTTSSSFDAASRITTAGYVYDALGRTTSVPARDAGGASLTATYYVNDMVHTLTPQDGSTRTFTLDPTQQRFRSWSEGAVTKVNHYAGAGDSPVWVDEGGGAWTRNITSIGGSLGAVQDSATGVSLQLVNLHGDIVATASLDPAATGPTATFESTEFGAPRDGATRRYAWLGAGQRSADAPGGLMLMGVRLYNPATGRFLQVDPVRGGSDNAYDYAGHDPVNAFDLDGRSVRQFWNDHHEAIIFTGAIVAVGICGFTAGLGCLAATVIVSGVSIASDTYDFYKKPNKTWADTVAYGGNVGINLWAGTKAAKGIVKIVKAAKKPPPAVDPWGKDSLRRVTERTERLNEASVNVVAEMVIVGNNAAVSGLSSANTSTPATPAASAPRSGGPSEGAVERKMRRFDETGYF